MTSQHPKRSWHKRKYRAISEHLASSDWDLKLYCLNADACFKHLTTILHRLIDEHVPVKPPPSPTNNPRWLKRPPSSLLNRRHAAWIRYKSVRAELGRKSTDAIAAYASFQTPNRSVRGFSVASQASYELNLLNQSRDRPKLLHSYIRDKKTARPSVGPIRLCSGELTDNPRAMAEAFASSFSSVYTKETLEHPAPGPHTRPITVPWARSLVTFSQNRVQLLDSNTSAGPDNLHPVLLKHWAACLAYPLHIIFLQAYLEGHLPSSWKSSLVISIFKKGERFDALNYRPISTTSVQCVAKPLSACFARTSLTTLSPTTSCPPTNSGFGRTGPPWTSSLWSMTVCLRAWTEEVSLT